MTTAIFDQVSQSSNKVLFLYNLQTNQFDYLSQNVTAFWGVERDTVLESPIRLLSTIDPDDQYALVRRFEQVRQGNACEIDFSLRFPGARSKQVKLHAHPLRDANQAVNAIAGEVEDITVLTQYLNYLMEFGRKKNNVMQIIAHDLQGPLAILKSATSLLEADLQDRNFKEVQTYLEIIHEACEDSTKLIRDVLQDEHIRSLAIAIKRNRFEVIERARQIAETFAKSQVVKTPIQVTGREEKIMAELDEVKFVQILNNLITNSIKFTPPEGEIAITIARQGRNLLLTHSDTGIGIPKDLQPYLFDKNERKSHRPGLNGEQSNGVGLTIIKDLVELQGGKIWFESEENKGTTFYISFPLPG